MSGLRGNVGSLRALQKRLNADPQVLAHKVAAAAVGAINSEALRTFSAGQAPTGYVWPESKVTGARVDLVESGRLRGQIRYVADGARIRCIIGVKYAKYQIGKRPVFPPRGAPLPAPYRDAIDRAVGPVYRAFYGVGQ